MSELKKCPFCGGEAELIKRKSNLPYIHGVWCIGCKCRTSFEKSEEIAIEKWNNRKPVEDVVKRLNLLKDNDVNVYGKRYSADSFAACYAEGINDAINIIKTELGG